MITIRDYRESDAAEVGRLIAETYAAFNLGFATPAELKLLLGPFQHAGSDDPAHQAAIAIVLRSEMVYVAEDAGAIVGVLRGRFERLASLFVRGDHQRQGIGRQLVERFEAESRRRGTGVIRVASTLYGIPFYLAMGYKRSTGLRNSRSFDGRHMPIQPMRKVFPKG
jgi:GNAT superfamily N-acetyltransferase